MSEFSLDKYFSAHGKFYVHIYSASAIYSALLQPFILRPPSL